MKKINFNEIDILRFGNEIQTVGTVLSDSTTLYLLEYPAADFSEKEIKQIVLTETDWQKLLTQLDTCETAVTWGDKKAFVRKSQRVIDSFVCWQAYKRDGYTCRYCGRDNLPLTVDHVILWEEGGPSVLENLITCCKPCNRERGSLPFASWIASSFYKRNLNNIPEALVAANSDVLSNLEHLRTLKAAPRTKRK